jgi:hypothetical protein
MTSIKLSPYILFLSVVWLNAQSLDCVGQEVILEGYTFESGNRGSINKVKVTLVPKDDPGNALKVFSNADGFFKVKLATSSTYTLTAEKILFQSSIQQVSTLDKKDGDKVFINLELNRNHDYGSTELNGQSTDKKPASTEGKELKEDREDRRLGREGGLVKQTQKPIDRTSNLDTKVRLENKIIDMLDERPTEMKALPIPENYSGYSIEIIVNKHPIRSKDLKIDVSDGIWFQQNSYGDYVYLVGTFREIQEASKYFDEKIASAYPNAKIIEFISGSRL